MTGAPDRARASGLVAAGIFLSRISGLVRESALAHYFGASPVLDAWRSALRAPNVLQNLLGEGTLSASFIPVYSELIGAGREREAARFAGAVLGLLTVVASAVALVGVLAAPWLVQALFPGFEPERRELTISLVRILFPMTAILVVSAWALGILNSHRRFFLPYAAPVVWNAAMILALLLGALVFDASGESLARILAWGALVGGGLQLVVQLPTALRLLAEFRPSFSLKVHGVSEAIRGFGPAFAARGAVNLSGYLDYFLASFLAVGATSVLGYAQTLYLLPISLFGVSVAASELPELARDRGLGAEAIARGVNHGIARVAYFLVPSAVGYLLFGDVIAALLFQRGSFGDQEVAVTWYVLAAYAVGMPASALSRLLSSSFYALRDTRTPARIAYIRVALSAVLAVALMFPFEGIAVGPLRLGAVGLALAAAVGGWTEWVLLSRALRRRIGPVGFPPGTLARLLWAGGLAGAVGLGGSLLFDRFEPWIEAAGLPEGSAPWIEAAGTLIPFAGVYFLVTSALRASTLGGSMLGGSILGTRGAGSSPGDDRP